MNYPFGTLRPLKRPYHPVLESVALHRPTASTTGPFAFLETSMTLLLRSLDQCPGGCATTPCANG